MRLILGLGNPGSKYEKTRHNAGFLAVDQLATNFGFEPFKESAKHTALIAEGQIGGKKVILAKPLTFMNRSGRTANSLVRFYKLAVEDFLVIYDDIAIASGKLRLRAEGSAGGHNGIKSLIQDLGTQTFNRLRVGIKPEKAFPGELSDYVLGKFSEDELVLLQENLDRIPGVIELWIKEGIEGVMNKVN